MHPSVCQLRRELDELKIEKAISERRARQATLPPSLPPSPPPPSIALSLSLCVCVCVCVLCAAGRS